MLSKIKVLVIFIPVLLCYQLQVLAYQIKESHPRLIEYSQMKEAIDRGEKRGIAHELRKKGDFDIRTPVHDLCSDRGRYLRYTKLYSLLYLLYKENKYYQKATILVNHIRQIPPGNDDYDILHQLEAFAYYYDLCFDAIKNDEKKEIMAAILERITWLDDHHLLRSANFGGSHLHYANKVVAYASIAIHGDAPWADEFINITYHNFKNGFWPFYRYLTEEDGGFHMWWEYSRYYIFDELEFQTIWKNATGEDLFQENKWLEKTFYFLLYGLRDDLTCWGTGDNHARGTGWIHRAIFEKIAGEYRNGYAKYSANKLEKERKGRPGIDELVYDLLWEDDTVKPVSVENLPLVKAFQRVGAYVFREGWKGDNVIALFKCTPIYFFNHSHRDANSFEIWYNEDLAIDSGYYDWYGSLHWFNYYIRSIAHNTVLIYEPNEVITPWNKVKSNDGGQRFSQWQHEQPYNVEDLKREAFHVADSQLLEDNEDYALAVGDATRAYSPHKCGQFKRYFLFLKRIENWKHPIIVVFDKVISTKQEYVKIWLLHSINKPKIEDNLITIVNGGGKLWCYIVQPDDFDIRLVGGKGREFEVNGINYPPDTTKKDDVEKWAGSWRVELREKMPRKETHYLNVLIPGEKSEANPPVVKKILNGVRIENWEVIYKDNELKVIKVTNHE